MYDKKDKRRIYYLIDIYLSEIIDEATFCDEFYYCYDLELDSETLTENENEAFIQLGKVVDRFSKFEEDIKEYPDFFCTEKELKQKIIETREKLKKRT